MILFLIIAGTLSATTADRIDVTKHGAIPGDKRDDSRVLQQLIDKLPASGGTLYFPLGEYTLQSPIVLKSNVKLEGAGIGKTVLLQAGSVQTWSRVPEQAVITTNVNLRNENVSVANLTLKGIYVNPIGEKGSGAKGGICLRNCINSTVESVRTSDTWHGVAFYDFKMKEAKSGNVIRQVTVERALSNSQPGNKGRPRGILINTPFGVVENSVTRNCGTGFFAGGEGISLLKNKAYSWTVDNGYYIMADNLNMDACEAYGGTAARQGLGSGITIAYSKGGKVKNCIVKYCSNYGYRIHVPQSDLLLENNLAERCGIGFGIENASHKYPEMSRNIQFLYNKSIANNMQGFLLRQLEGAVLRGNQVLNNNQKGVSRSNMGGISLGDHCFDNVIEDNDVNDTQSKKTQLYGLYDASMNKATNAKGAAVQQNAVRSAGSSQAARSRSNTIKHKSKYGRDVF